MVVLVPRLEAARALSDELIDTLNAFVENGSKSCERGSLWPPCFSSRHPEMHSSGVSARLSDDRAPTSPGHEKHSPW